MVCCIFNFPSHYRQEIYLKMEREFGCDFFFGDIEKEKIKKIDYNLFRQNIKELHTVILMKNFNWIRGSVKLSFKRRYRCYLLTGEPYCLSSWWILIFNKIQGKKTYLWTHGWYGNESNVKSIIKKLYFNLANGILLYGEYARDLMSQKGFAERKLNVIYNSLFYEDQLQIRTTLVKTNVYKELFDNDYPVIIFTGRLTKVKKLDQLFEAQKLLLDRGVKLNVFVIGDGEEKDQLSSIVNKFGISEYVKFFGACYDELKIAEYYYNASACVSPGNVGLTAIHALTYGCPVITHSNFCNQMPEFETVEEGETGYFFMENNIVDLAEKMKLTLNKMTGAQKAKIREKCFEKIDKYYNPNYQLAVIKEAIKSS